MCVCVCLWKDVGKGGAADAPALLFHNLSASLLSCPERCVWSSLCVNFSDDSVLDKSTTFRSVGFPGESGRGLDCVSHPSHCSVLPASCINNRAVRRIST